MSYYLELTTFLQWHAQHFRNFHAVEIQVLFALTGHLPYLSQIPLTHSLGEH